jgi:hypothetical protein
MVQTIEKSGKHRRADSKATYTQQAVYPVATDIPPCGLNVMQKHSQGCFNFDAKGSFNNASLLQREFLYDASVKEVDDTVGV